MQEITHRFRAMGTLVGLWLWHHDRERAQAVLLQAEQFFVQTEARLSRFLPNSELSRLNRAAGRPFRASRLLFQLVHTALNWRAQTNGIFDPTILNALMAQGYDRSFEQIGSCAHSSPSPAGHEPGRVRLGWSKRTITLAQGVGLDLGGLAKGWAVQRAAHQLGQYGPALVDAGGDVACTLPPPDQPFWAVGLADPYAPHRDIATLFLDREAVATSTQTGRRWVHQGGPAHHLIDPRTGVSAASNLAGVTIIAGRLPDAEIHAKVALILGEEAGMAYLANYPKLAAIIVTTDGRRLTYGNLEGKAYVHTNASNPAVFNLA
jgi:thiamine biosynthesis lipoprotein